MKIINDYFKFEDYKNKAKAEFHPKLDEIIKKNIQSLLKKLLDYKMRQKKLNITSSISFFLTIIVILVATNTQLGYTSIIFAIIPGIIAIVSTFYLGFKKKEIRKITDEISKDVLVNFRPEVAYKAAFSILDKGMDYLGFNDQPSNKIQISKTKLLTLLP
ncbi:hypothetical protein V2P72_01880 [Mesomycoplasma hyopneumoniae]|uniref:hypothetical protein n=1 Tax=Mesomycoplasma hyopneumoniae TaxID=2099 RepID=UPI003DA4F187